MFERRVAISWFPWDSQPTYCSAVCAPQVCALPHRDRDLGFSNNLLLGCSCSTGLCGATQRQGHDLGFSGTGIWDLGFSGNLLFSCLCSTGFALHIETGIWDSQTTYCWAVHAPQVCAEPHRDRDMIWNFQATLLLSCLCSTGFALPHRDNQ